MSEIIITCIVAAIVSMAYVFIRESRRSRDFIPPLPPNFYNGVQGGPYNGVQGGPGMNRMTQGFQMYRSPYGAHAPQRLTPDVNELPESKGPYLLGAHSGNPPKSLQNPESEM